MFRQLKKNLVATLIAAMTIGQVAPAFADSADTLPDMGTSAGSTLSIGRIRYLIFCLQSTKEMMRCRR